MTNDLASFQDLKGIGPATASRLHQAGILTWEGLAEVAGALSGVRGVSAGALRGLSRLAAEHHNDEAGDEAPAAQRREAFVVRLEQAAEGSPSRTGVVHVGSQREQQWPGWAPEGLVGFIAQFADLPADRPPAPASPGESVEGPTSALHGVPHAAVSDAAASALPGLSPMVLAAGKLIGGLHRAVDIDVPAECLRRPGEASVRYRARLRSRPFGAGQGVASAPVAELAGLCPSDAPLHLTFADVDLPPGVQLLDVTIEVVSVPTRSTTTGTAERDMPSAMPVLTPAGALLARQHAPATGSRPRPSQLRHR